MLGSIVCCQSWQMDVEAVLVGLKRGFGALDWQGGLFLTSVVIG